MNGYLNIEVEGIADEEELLIEIYDVSGKKVFHKTYNLTSQQT